MSTECNMKKFIEITSELSKNHRNSTDSMVHQVLQSLVVSSNMNDFDPESTTTTQFFIRLHELIGDMDVESPLLWLAIDVLLKACENSFAKVALSHTYKFVPLLTKFLKTDQVCDKRFKLLQLLMLLTYGLKITWQEAHLPYLVSTLVQITLLGELSHRPLALEILVNLCHKNLPVLYLLTRKVEINGFIKAITNMNNNPTVRMLVCKMLIIIEQMKGDLPDGIVLNFVDVTFNSVADAYQKKDSALLKTIVDFFEDVKESSHCCKIIAQYPKCLEDAKRILDFIEADYSDGPVEECIIILLRFIPIVISNNVQKTSKLLPRCLAISMRFINNEITCLPALNIIRMVTDYLLSQQFPNGDNVILAKLKETLPDIINLLKEYANGFECNRLRKQILTELVGLLGAFVEAPDLRMQALSYLSLESVRNIIQKMLKEHDAIGVQQSVHHITGSEICIRLLAVTASLAPYDEDWKLLNLELLGKRQILTAIAISFIEGIKAEKYEVLKLISSTVWNKDQLTALSEIMCEIGPSVGVNNIASNTIQSSAKAFIPCYNYNQESRLNELLDALHLEREVGRLSDTSTSAVMELYDYKLASMGHAERRIQEALETADMSCTRLNHQVAQLRGEVSQLFQMLFSSQQCVEGVTLEKNDLMKKLKTINEQMALEKSQHSRQIKELKVHIQKLESVVRARDVEITAVSAVRDEVTKECESMKKSYRECESKYDSLSKENAITKERLKAMENENTQYKADISKLQENLENMEMSLNQYMQDNKEKDSHIEECIKKIEELENIRKIVFNVASRTELHCTNITNN